MNFMKGVKHLKHLNLLKMVPLDSKGEAKVLRKTLRVEQKRVRDKQLRFDRHLKVLWSE